MNMVDRIRTTLTQGLAPERLEVIDESALHAGHAGAVPGKTTHIRVRIMSAAFAGKSRIERHRLVNGLLAPEIAAGLHALAIEARTPGE
jgi:BolA family transcriptional regulator, general stress-responsive regulator